MRPSTAPIIAACLLTMLLPCLLLLCLSHSSSDVDPPYADSLDRFMSGAAPRSRAEGCFFRLRMTYPGDPDVGVLRECAAASI